jgi:transcriptional regulator of acetoin/glycerol metabolism
MNTEYSSENSGSNAFANWQAFLQDDLQGCNDLRKVILKSWTRCVESGVDPLGMQRHDYLDSEKLADVLTDRKRLLDVARSFMADLYEIVRGSGFVVVLTDEQGYIIELFADSLSSQESITSNFFIGASWHEEEAGTNAIGTAIEEKKPVQVTGAEHFCKKHHGLTCSAAPIYNPRGKLIGILDISGAYQRAHAHTLGMVVAAAKAITGQLRIIRKNRQLAVANQKLTTFFNMVSDGVLVLDRDGKVTELNPAAERIFKRKRSELTGVRLRSLMTAGASSDGACLAFSSPQHCSEIELAVETSAGSCRCLASVEPIISEQESFTGSFITLRPIKAVRNLVNRFSGYSASLQFPDIIGESPEMREAIELAKLSAQAASNVLLQGESGTGKEIFAQAIHNQSSRRDAPFIPLNCGAIPRELVGSELFGYEEGAFTGASKGGKPGKFELASGGTLFLDEIGDMPLEQQAVLLRVIQEKQMMRIGGLKVIPVDVRLICATHKNLLEKVQNGTFRQDLYYRLNVMSIIIPPLRERVADIPSLFTHFLDRLCSDREASLAVDHDLMHYLYSYPWPGNVRELQNVVERAANLAVNGTVGVNQLPHEIVHINASKEVSSAAVQPGTNLRKHRLKQKEREKNQILHLLNTCDGNISRVARELGVSRKTVYNRMHRHGLSG